MKITKLKLLLFLSFLILSNSLFAQSNHFLLRSDKSHDKVKTYYKNLIEKSELNFMLSDVIDVSVKNDILVVNLKFNSTNSDTILSMWNQTKPIFKDNFKISLQDYLYSRGCTYFSISPNNFFLSIGDIEKCPNWQVYGNRQNNTIIINTDSILCMSVKPNPIAIDLPRFSKKNTLNKKQTKANATQIYSLVNDYLNERFVKKNKCKHRKPEVFSEFIGLDRTHFLFEINDLCSQVLKPSVVIEYFGLEARERFIFTFNYEATEDGFILKVEVEGFIGSGLWSTLNDEGYMDIEEDHKAAFKKYAKKLSLDLEKHLQKKLK